MTEQMMRAVAETAWAIDRGYLLRAMQTVAREGPREQAALPRRIARQNGAVVTIPIRGPIQHREDVFMRLFGVGTSTEAIGRAFDQAVADPAVKAVVLDIDSPGGEVAGTPELADQIFAARGRKPIVAVANAFMASGAYYLGSQADELVATPSAQVGSIGVWMAHADESKLLEALGVTVTLVSAGEHKVDGNPFEPLSDAARANMQARVDEAYELFVGAVARGRGVPLDRVRSGYGRGAVLAATAALAQGMVDRIEPLEVTMRRQGVASASELRRSQTRVAQRLASRR